MYEIIYIINIYTLFTTKKKYNQLLNILYKINIGLYQIYYKNNIYQIDIS